MRVLSMIVRFTGILFYLGVVGEQNWDLPSLRDLHRKPEGDVVTIDPKISSNARIPSAES